MLTATLMGGWWLADWRGGIVSRGLYASTPRWEKSGNHDVGRMGDQY